MDWVQIISLGVLFTIGIVFINSIGRQVGTPMALGFWQKQLQWICIGGVFFLTLSMSDYRKFELFSFAFYLGCLILLIAVPLVGVKVYGAKRWLDLYYMRLQPSELSKLSVIVALSALFANRMFSPTSLKCIFLTLLTVGIPFILIFSQPDLGSALILLPSAAAVWLASEIKLKYFLVLMGAALLLGGVFAANEIWGRGVLKDYHRARIAVFLDPEKDLLGKGYNTFQSKLAVGSGGMFGKGLGHGTQSSLGFLPTSVSNNDFIFSVIAEESGFAGVLLLLGAYAMLIYSMLRTAYVSSDVFGRCLGAGIAALFFTHCFINIAMSVGMMPVTGLPLPFVSYGGSFIFTGLAACGIMQSIYRHRSAI